MSQSSSQDKRSYFMHQIDDSSPKDRIIGRINGDKDGPWIIAIAGMHGNEKGGVKALERTILKVQSHIKDFKGNLLALRGNLPALQKNVRFIDEDINRLWFPDIISKIQNSSIDELQTSERREIKKLFGVIDTFLSRKQNMDKPIIFLDFHSFSADGAMFGITTPSHKSIDLFSNLNIPLILGIEKFILGAAFDYYQKIGDISLVFEGGQHDDPKTVDNITGVMLSILENLECVTASEIPKLEDYKTSLNQQNKSLPKTIKVVYRHPVNPEDRFAMRPGYQNLQAISKGECLADDHSGEILSPMDGYILMPLYQKQGKDGFFIAIDA